jgi:WD40 repeat protein
MTEDLASNNQSPSLLQRIDVICDRFERAWRQRPRIEDYLAEVESDEQEPLLRELLKVELAYRVIGGEPINLEEYQQRFPLHAELVAALVKEAARRDPCSTVVIAEQSTGNASPNSALPAGETGPFIPGNENDPNPIPGRMNAGDGTGVPLVLGDYELLDRLGKGGMGVVYRARQRSANRIVALKVIRPELLEDVPPEQRQEWLRRFRAEGQAAARVDHDNVVTVHEVGEADGQLFYSMRYVDGRSLADMLREHGPMPDRRAAAYLEPVARALHHVHSHGILHRDLKPGNILVDGSGRPLVADFGLAKWLSDEPNTNPTRGALGTPEYMAPEQARNATLAVAASDVYSLGATLYALITGRPPFQAPDPVETMRQVIDKEPVPPRRLNPAIARDLETVCLKCLDKQPGKRYGSAEELACDLKSFLEGKPIRARPVSGAERLWRWSRRNPYLATAGSLAAAALVSVAVVSSLFARHYFRAADDLGRAADDLRDEHTKTVTALDDVRIERDRVKSRLAENYLNQGLATCALENDPVKGMLQMVRGLETAPDKNAKLQRTIRTELTAWGREFHAQGPILSHEAPLTAMVFSPDGKTVLMGSVDNTARLWDATTGKAIGPPLQHKMSIAAVAFSPDGKTVLTGSEDNTARLWEVATGKALGPPLQHQGPVGTVAFSADGKTVLTYGGRIVKRWEGATGEALGPPFQDQEFTFAVFSPDGKMVLTGTEDKTLQLWEAATGKAIGPPLKHQDAVTPVAFSPDGKTVLTGSVDDTARLWEATTGKAIGPPLQHQGMVNAVAFSPDGKTVLTGSVDNTARLWEATTGKAIGPPLQHQGMVNAVAFSPDGKTVLTGTGDHFFGGSGDGTARLWEVATGKALGPPLQHEGPVGAVAFSPDGKTVLTASNKTVRLWEAATGNAPARPLQHQDAVVSVAFSPDGKTVLTGSYDKTARLWEAATGKSLGPPLQHQDPVSAVAFSPDGKTLLTGGGSHAFLWKASTRKAIGPPLLHPGTVLYNPDGKTVLTWGNSRAQLWDAATGDALGSAFGVSRLGRYRGLRPRRQDPADGQF